MEKIKDSESCSSRDIAREDFELQREKKQLVGLELWVARAHARLSHERCRATPGLSNCLSDTKANES